MGARHRQRPAFVADAYYQSVPKFWASVPNMGSPISPTTRLNLTFVPMKTPTTLSPWTVANAVESAKAISSTAIIHAVNVSKKSECVSSNDWEASGITYERIHIPDDYSQEAFSTYVKDVSSDNKEHMFLVYSGRMSNRVGFSILSFLVNECDTQFDDAFKLVSQSVPIFNPAAVEKIAEKANQQVPELQPKPEYFNESEGNKGAPTDVSIPIAKLSDYQQFLSTKPVSQEMTDEYISFVKKALPEDWPTVDGIPSLKPSYYQQRPSGSLLATFNCVGHRGFLAVRDESFVCFIGADGKMRQIMARSSFQQPLVASCIITQEKRRVVVLITDIFKFGQTDLNGKSLEERLSIAAQKIVPKITCEFRQIYLMQFAVRPVAHIQDIKRLYDSLSSLFCRCEGLVVIPDNNDHCRDIILIDRPSGLFIPVDNGNDKFVIYCRQDVESQIPYAIIDVKGKKLIGCHGRVTRCEFKDNQWVIISLAQHAEMLTIKYELDRIVEIIQSGFDIQKTIQQM